MYILVKANHVTIYLLFSDKRKKGRKKKRKKKIEKIQMIQFDQNAIENMYRSNEKSNKRNSNFLTTPKACFTTFHPLSVACVFFNWHLLFLLFSRMSSRR